MVRSAPILRCGEGVWCVPAYRQIGRQIGRQTGDGYPMPLDKSAVETIAYLARIRIADNELETLAGELDHIIGWVEQLSEVDTDGVEPMTSGAVLHRA
jgi:hypothetical protein